MNLLFLCVSVAVTSSTVVLWRKRYSSMEARKVQISDEMTSRTLPSSNLNDSDGELESYSHESLVEATTVHYGRRPDIKGGELSFLYSFLSMGEN